MKAKLALAVLIQRLAIAAFAAGPGGGGMPPGGGGNQPGGGGSATFTFDTFLAVATTNASKCIVREGVWAGWTSGIADAALPVSVVRLAEGVCAGCATLTSVDLSQCTALAEIPDSAFAGCTALTTVTLPATVTAIGANAFAGCTALSSVTASGVVTVGADAFHGCTALAAIPPSAAALGAYSFAGTALTSVDARSLSLGAGAFAGCGSLATATVASGATLPDALFCGCPSLSSLNTGDVAEFGRSSLAGCDALAALTLDPYATLAAYALAANEATVATTLVQSSLPAFGATAFLGREVSYVPVAGSVTRIEAKDLVDWLTDAEASSSVAQPADYSTATLKTWLSTPSNAYAYAYADDLAADAGFTGLTVVGTRFAYNAPSDAAISITVVPVASYTLSSEAGDWSAANLTWSVSDNAYIAADPTQASCFARLRFTWNW